jgi:hypothetical protein
MQVICINSASYDVLLDAAIFSPVSVGTTYTVTSQQQHWGKIYYTLQGFKQTIGFAAECFLECSNLDETELINHPIKKKK